MDIETNTENIESFESRKRDHIRESLNSANQAIGLSGFDSIVLVHDALPDLNFEDITLTTQSLGYERKTPFFVSSMTAGHREGVAINATLAKVCAQKGWPLAVGSQRRQLFDREASAEWLKIREQAPGAVFFGNLGIAQVIQTDTDSIKRLVDSLEAQALFVHLNALQECIQPEGTPQFAGGLAAIEKLVKYLNVPVLVKETGCGMSASLIKRLSNIGVAAIDVAGLGGTHWGRIEGRRGGDQTQRFAETFANWGIPTAECLLIAQGQSDHSEIWASGGIRTGLDAAKSISLGAKLVGFAKPALENALKGEERLSDWCDSVEKELKIAMFCTASLKTSALKGKYGIKF